MPPSSARGRVRGMGKAKEREPRPKVNLRRFLLSYLLLMGGFFVLVAFRPIQQVVDINGIYTRGIVTLAVKMLSGMGIPCAAHGSIIALPRLALDVKFGCNGLEAVMIYSVAILAYPAPWKRRLAGMAAGLVVIQAVNLLRILGLAYAGLHMGSLFRYIHIYVAQGIMIAVSLGLFFAYMAYAEA